MSRPLTREERAEITRRHIDFSLRGKPDGSWEVLERGVPTQMYGHRADAVDALLRCYRGALRRARNREALAAVGEALGIHPANAPGLARALRRGIESARKSRDDTDGSDHD